MRLQKSLTATLVCHVTLFMAQSCLWNKNIYFIAQAAFQRSLPVVTHRQSTSLSFERLDTSPTTLVKKSREFFHLKAVENISSEEGNDVQNFFVSLPEDVYSTQLVSRSRRKMMLQSITSIISFSTIVGYTQPKLACALEGDTIEKEKVLVVLSGETKQLFNEGRAKEMQGNIAAANRIYNKVVNLVPRFIYGWSNLGNTQVIIGKLDDAENSYSTAIDLCKENLDLVGDQFGVRRCDDLYVLYLNRGCLRLNNNMRKEALKDLELSATLRGKPDAVVLQNRARARELNNMYAAADRDYDVAISMTSNEVAPFWLRAALVKYQLGDYLGALDLLRRVEVKFPEAPEVRAALSAMLAKKGDKVGANQKFLEIPDKQRLNFGNLEYLTNTVAWPANMIDSIRGVAQDVGDI